MGFLGTIFLAIGLWFFYNLFVKLIWPIYKTTRHLRQQFRHMAEQDKTAPSDGPTMKKEAPKQSKVGEYIDFQEVK